MKTKVVNLPTKHETKKFLVLSDLHIASFKETKILISIYNLIAEKIELNDEDYDAFFLVGDLIDATDVLQDDQVVSSILAFLEHLADLAPVYITLGNHDLCSHNNYHSKAKKKRKWWKKDETSFKKYIQEKFEDIPGVIVSENGTFSLDKECTVSIFTPPTGYITANEREKYVYLRNNEYCYKYLKFLNPEKTNILLCHYPNVIDFLHDRDFLKNVDLAVCGHNHNGLTQFLFLESILDKLGKPNRGIVTPEKSFKSKDTCEMRGLIELDKRTKLYIAPAVTSLSKNTKILHMFNPLFYKGISEISLVKDEKEDE